MEISKELRNYIDKRYVGVYGVLPEIKIVAAALHLGVEKIDISDIPDMIKKSIDLSIQEWIKEWFEKDAFFLGEGI